MVAYHAGQYPIEIGDILNSFFENKICKIRKYLDDGIDEDLPEFYSYDGLKLNTFNIVDEDFVKKLLNSTAPKSCQLDPIPTHLF